jgi:hypothetical protein
MVKIGLEDKNRLFWMAETLRCRQLALDEPSPVLAKVITATEEAIQEIGEILRQTKKGEDHVETYRCCCFMPCPHWGLLR